jgi:deoxyribodipyrimidine photo-lyase
VTCGFTTIQRWLGRVEEAERVVPLFVFDEAVTSQPIACPNKIAFLLDAVADLAATLRDMGGSLVTRRGRFIDEVAAVAAEFHAGAVFASKDVSAFARQREHTLQAALNHALPDPVELRLCEGVTVVPAGRVTTASGGAYKVFTPYWRQWQQVERRPVLPAPEVMRVPPGARTGQGPSLDVPASALSPELPEGGEAAGRALLDAWLDGPVTGYDKTRDDLAADASSRLSPYLHLGCLSPVEVATRAAQAGDAGADAFVRQLCWRDFYHQVLAARPETSWEDWRSQGDVWATNEGHLHAWKEGRTGYPIVDAGMRQLRREGWMHNRARLIVGSFLTRDLYLDWRAGARHFLEWLVDGDIANNQLNWQWVAGTGTTSRRNRALNPLRQAERYDPDGDYVRRYVPELRSVNGAAVHRPWALPTDVRAGLDYPEPIVDHDEAVDRFLRARGNV